jgi:predicted ATPase
MPAHNLPVNTSPFVGRTRELGDVLRLLADPACRLLTLVGPGGMGKTRLALEAARQMLENDQQAETANHPSEFPDGAFIVALQSITAPQYIATAIADALHFQFYQGDEPLEQLLCFLRDKALLLLLDNFEHVLEGVELVETLLVEASGVKILATSREPLNLQQEWLFTVEGMHFPRLDDAQPLENYSAARLFAQAARRLRPDFSLDAERDGVRRICALVEGMPLALELAASWVRTLSSAEIANEITRGLDILETSTRNIPQRHRSMRAVLDYSWSQLSDEERAALQRLSVFRGGFTRAAAEAVAGASLRTLSALVNKSLLRHDPIGRYDLHELVRQYAREQLDAVKDAYATTAARHTAYYGEFMAQRWADLRSSQQRAAIAEIDGEIENVRAAWAYAVEQHNYAVIGQMVLALWYVHVLTYRSKDAHELFSRSIAALRSAPVTPASQRVLGLLLITQGSILAEKGGHIQAGSMMVEGRDWLQEGLQLLRQNAATPEELVLALCSLCYSSIMLLG